MDSTASPKVNILLSTYNGERFIVEQLNSLFNQTYPNINIYIRDDGSTDNTVNLIKSLSPNNKLINLDTGNNIGVNSSFLQLLANNGNPGDLYAFCDQDDIWKPEKIERAVEKIMGRPEPGQVLYCTRQEFVDENLNHLGYSLIPRHIGIRNAAVENIATGCTVVLGEKIRELLLRGNPDDMMMHDWWAYLIASVFGDVVFDEFPSIQYRQHNNTVTVAWKPVIAKFRARFFKLIPSMLFRREYSSGGHKRSGLESLNQAIHFLEAYPDAPKAAKLVVNTPIKLRRNGKLFERINYVIHPGVLRTNLLENLVLKAMIVLDSH